MRDLNLKIKNVIHTDIDYTSGSIPFLIALAEDDKLYQIKLPNVHTSSMLKEYIANQVAEKIGNFTPKGVFLRFLVEDELLPMINQIIEYSESSASNEPFFTLLKDLKNEKNEVVLFGIEWLTEKEVIINDIEDLYDAFDRCKSDNHYATFAFDQLLVNKDRHIKNILVCTNENESVDTYLIDHDRIFSTRGGIEEFTNIKDIFDCLKNRNEFLYKYITTEEQKSKILYFAQKIKELEKDDIIEILKVFRDNCPPEIIQHDDVIEKISSFISYRATNIKSACNKNFEEGLCYA